MLRQLIARNHRGASGGDPYWDKVVSLLHFDGTDGSTNVVDEITSNSWSCLGAVALDTDNKKFGTASIICPTRSTTNALRGPSSLSAFEGDFSVEFFAYLVQNSTAFNACLFNVDNVNSTRGFQLSWNSDNTINASVVGGKVITSQNVINLNQWNYIAFCASGDIGYLHINGTMTQGDWVQGQGNATEPLTFFSHVNGVTNMIGAIDEFRLTKGVARYTSSFAIPTAPFPNHG